MKIPFKVDLTGKTAIVTGGSGTLCSAMAYGLAVSGAKTAIIGRNQEKLLKVVNKLTEDALNEYGKDVIVKGYSCNVTDKNELEKTYSLISSELGMCDILINGAGGNQPGAIASTEMLKKEKGEDDYSFWNLDEDKIRDVMDVNYMGTLLPIQVFTKDMVEKDDTLLLQAFPTTFFIDKDGNIVDSIEGSNDYDGWKAKIDEVLKKVEANE